MNFSDMGIEERTAYLEAQKGKYSRTPYSHVNYCIDIGRQMGKTSKLISLITSPSILLTWNLSHGRYILEDIKKVREDIDTKGIMIFSYGDPDHLEKIQRIQRSRQSPLPVFVDNAVLDIIQYNFVKTYNRGML